ncbi:hypothetical protein B0I37DRAFT_148285 [Chaetomium sp. MPI-CAGE-AT-0009]|nr:hypothetical protein B0I37DRAFT_148285 [Chaetomium sp. MPI-CAGE-AT-0009]
MHTTSTFLTALTSASLALASPAPAPEPHPALVTPAPMLHPAAARLGVRQFRQSTDSELSKSIECGREYLSLADTIPRETNTDLAKWLLTAASPAAEIISATSIDDSLTSLCDPSLTATLTPPASLSSAWSTYLEHASSWVTSVAPAASSLAQSCGGEISAAIQFLLVSDSETCTKAVLGLVDVLDGDSDATTTGDSGASPTRTTSAGESETSSAGGDGDDEDDNNDGNDNSGSGNGGSGQGNDDSDDGSEQTGPAGAAETSSTSTAGVPRETGMMGVAAAAAVAVAGVVAAL